jgi:hypothetical protein
MLLHTQKHTLVQFDVSNDMYCPVLHCGQQKLKSRPPNSFHSKINDINTTANVTCSYQPLAYMHAQTFFIAAPCMQVRKIWNACAI